MKDLEKIIDYFKQKETWCNDILLPTEQELDISNWFEFVYLLAHLYFSEFSTLMIMASKTNPELMARLLCVSETRDYPEFVLTKERIIKLHTLTLCSDLFSQATKTMIKKIIQENKS